MKSHILVVSFWYCQEWPNDHRENYRSFSCTFPFYSLVQIFLKALHSLPDERRIAYSGGCIEHKQPRPKNYLCQCCILFNLWSRTWHHKEHQVCLPRFATVDWEGWSTALFHLRQTGWFLYFYFTILSFLSSNIPSSAAYGFFIFQIIRYARAWYSYEWVILKHQATFK